METMKLKELMMKFSDKDLKSFLGDDLVASLLEWQNNNYSLFTKSKLTEMIISVHGTSILSQTEFRQKLLRAMKEDDLHKFREYLPSQYSQCNDMENLIDIIVSRPWKADCVNNFFLEFLGFDSENIFAKKETDTVAQIEIAANEKFYELLDYQYIIRQQALNILSSGNDLQRFIIHMPTGTGKTKTAMHIICHHYNFNLKKQGLVIWIAHTSELLQQAYDTFVSVWKNIGNGQITTYKNWGCYDVDFSAGNLSGFMVCSIQKLQAMRIGKPEKFETLVHNASLIVYDEAHKSLASETRKVVESFMTKKEGMANRNLMGLTATPGRTTAYSDENNNFTNMFDNRIIGINTEVISKINMSEQEFLNAEIEGDIIKYFQKRGVLSFIEKEELEYEISDNFLHDVKTIATANGYDDFASDFLEKLATNRNRNLRIIQKLLELNNAQIPTIVFACSLKHGKLLSAMLTLENIPNVFIKGNMDSAARKDAITKFKDASDETNIIINYEVLTTGFDATNIGCVFIARPTQSVVLYSQMIGRGLRGPQMGGKEKCLLVDVKDNLEKYNVNMAFSHFDNYWS